MKSVTDATFEAEVLKSPIPVLVDFWAEWCGPCKQLAPILEALEGEYAGRVAFVKVNVEEAPSAPTKFGVRNLPTLVIFKDGKPLGVASGSRPRAAVQTWIDGLLKG